MAYLDPVRDAALRVCLKVFEQGAFLDIAADVALRRGRLSERGSRFFTHLAFGTVRHKTLADYVLRPLVRQPLERLPGPVLTILRMGIFQALFCRQVTRPALVHTSVELAKRYGHRGTARLVNAVLRRVPRSLEEISWPDRNADLKAFLAVRYSAPDWIIDLWMEELGPETAERLCATSNEQAPAALRANTLRIQTEQLRAGLVRAHCLVEKTTEIPEELTVLGGTPATRTRLFKEGCFMMQDPAAMIGAHLLEPQPAERILDLCAAPGGKTTHIAEWSNGLAHIAALDIHPGRLQLVKDNIQRLRTPNVSLVCADGRVPPFETGGFDRVLVDAPCSGLGTLRRRPDIKWRLRKTDLEDLAQLQEHLLRSGIRLCKNGGLIVYGVCTFTKRETDQVVQRVLSTEPVAPVDGAEWLNRWRTGPGTYRTMPHREAMDGFFWMRLRKAS